MPSKMLPLWCFVIAITPFLVASRDLLFSCDFEKDMCNMVQNKTNDFDWMVGNKNGWKTQDMDNTRSKQHLYTTKKRLFQKSYKSTIATPALHYQGRICITFYLGLTGLRNDNFGLLLYSPPDIDKIWTSIGMSIPAWKYMDFAYTLLCMNDYIAFSVYVEGTRPGENSDPMKDAAFVQIDELSITKGCCDPKDCPAKWSTWSSWGDCDRTCGQGRQYRQRFCDKPSGGDCPGDRAETKDCIIKLECPAIWVTWSSWSDCDVTCGKGMKERSRICENLANIDPCVGESKETAPCDVSCDGRACVANCLRCDSNKTICDKDGCAPSYQRTPNGMCRNESKAPVIAAVDSGSRGIGNGLMIGLIVIGLIALLLCILGAVVALIRRRRKMSREERLLKETLEQAHARAQAQNVTEVIQEEGEEEKPPPKKKKGSASDSTKPKKGRKSVKGKRKKIKKPAEVLA